MREDIKNIVDKKDFSSLENVWMEMIEQPDVALAEFFELADTLKASGAQAQAYLLMEILAGHYEAIKDYDRSIAVTKKLPLYTTDDLPVRKNISRLLRAAYKASPYIDRYLELSGIEKGDHFFKAMEKIEEHLFFDAGKIFYSEKYGLGRVKEVLPEKRELIIDFEKQPRFFMKYDIARGLLVPVSTDHFLYKKKHDPESLKNAAAVDPLGLIKHLLAGFPEPLDPARIKKYLAGIIADDEIGRWWEKARKLAEKDPGIKVIGKTQKRYAPAATGTDHAADLLREFGRATAPEKYAIAAGLEKKNPDEFARLVPALVKLADEKHKTEPALALDIMMLLDDVRPAPFFEFRREEILARVPLAELVLQSHDLNHQRLLLDEIAGAVPADAAKDYQKIMLAASDARLLGEVEKRLARHPEVRKDIYRQIFMRSQNYPDQYSWLLKKMTRGEHPELLAPGLLPRIIASLDHVRGIKTTVLKMLDYETFDRLVSQGSPDEAARIRTSLNLCRSFTDHEKQRYFAIIEYHFPQFAKRDDLIYVTATALKRKKDDLDRLLNVDIPANKKDIGKAREFGDLSENFEYKAAKERQDQLYQRARDLETELSKARLIDPAAVDPRQVVVGTTVKLKNEKTGELAVYTILGRWDTDLEHNIISNESPLGINLLGKTVGQPVMLEAAEYLVIAIERVSLDDVR